MEVNHPNVLHEDAERSASFGFSMPSHFFPAGALQGDARRMSRVAASTENVLTFSLVRGIAPNTSASTALCLSRILVSILTDIFRKCQKTT